MITSSYFLNNAGRRKKKTQKKNEQKKKKIQMKIVWKLFKYIHDFVAGLVVFLNLNPFSSIWFFFFCSEENVNITKEII